MEILGFKKMAESKGQHYEVSQLWRRACRKYKAPYEE